MLRRLTRRPLVAPSTRCSLRFGGGGDHGDSHSVAVSEGRATVPDFWNSRKSLCHGRTGTEVHSTFPRESAVGKTILGIFVASLMMWAMAPDRPRFPAEGSLSLLSYERRDAGAGGTTTWNRPGHNAGVTLETGPQTWDGISGPRYANFPTGEFFYKPSRWGPAGYFMQFQQIFGGAEAPAAEEAGGHGDHHHGGGGHH